MSGVNAAVQTFFSDFIGGAAVPLFFMISGFLFYTDFGLKKFPKKLKSRVG